jgi:hypothetical protein
VFFFRSFPFLQREIQSTALASRNEEAHFLARFGAAHRSDRLLFLRAKTNEVTPQWTKESRTGESFEC